MPPLKPLLSLSVSPPVVLALTMLVLTACSAAPDISMSIHGGMGTKVEDRVESSFTVNQASRFFELSCFFFFLLLLSHLSTLPYPPPHIPTCSSTCIRYLYAITVHPNSSPAESKLLINLSCFFFLLKIFLFRNRCILVRTIIHRYPLQGIIIHIIV